MKFKINTSQLIKFRTQYSL